jgi:hypothetical protein
MSSLITGSDGWFVELDDFLDLLVEVARITIDLFPDRTTTSSRRMGPTAPPPRQSSTKADQPIEGIAPKDCDRLSLPGMVDSGSDSDTGAGGRSHSGIRSFADVSDCACPGF